MDNSRYFEIAKQISYLSEFNRVKIGAVIVKKKDIIAVSCNLKKTHPIQAELNKYREDIHRKKCSYLHAEMAAILKSKIDLNGASIYIFREDRNGNLGLCKPCPACMEMIKSKNIKNVYYTSKEGYKKYIVNRRKL